MAACADGAKDERERAQLKSIAESLSAGSGINLAGLYQDVLVRRRSLAGEAKALQSPETKQLAYEMAVCVCDADGAHNEAEAKLLNSLRLALGLDAGAAQPYAGTAAAIASAPLAESAVPGATVDAAELDRSILNYAILNGALELLPESLATMAIIPLQMKMVYGIGKAHGYELDRGHVKDLLATLRVGRTAQYVEGIGRKLIGRPAAAGRRRLGGDAGRAGGQLGDGLRDDLRPGPGCERYYGGGRTLGTDQLRAAFQSLLGKAETLRSRYAGEIAEKAKTIDVSQLLAKAKQH